MNNATANGRTEGRVENAPQSQRLGKVARPRDWRHRYVRRLIFTDILVLVWVIFGAQIVWFGVSEPDVTLDDRAGDLALSYWVLSIVLVAAWAITLGVFGSRSYRVLGAGPQEYKLVMDASLRLFGLLAIGAFLFKIDFARGYILIAFPLGVVTLLLSRWLWRQWLGAQRARGESCSRVVLVGSEASVVYLAKELARQPMAGYLVVAVCIPADGPNERLGTPDVPIFRGIGQLTEAMTAAEADTVVIASSEDLSPEKVRQISWGLEPGRQHLVVAPSLTDIGGPRIHTRPVAGLPLIHVETPSFSGTKNFAKRAFDVVASGVLLIGIWPLLVCIGIVVRASSKGPSLFRQQRVGINGSRFHMLKFRSMVVDAESQLTNLRSDKHDSGNGVLFKMVDDPRVTPVGRFLRRFSLDELPQIFNVLNGSMSLVGPRPPLEKEVDLYDLHVHRRFLVKPGITGLWQVSGRSNLSWDDSVRLDLYYVENWSITGDMVILWKTLRAVLARDGAF